MQELTGAGYVDFDRSIGEHVIHAVSISGDFDGGTLQFLTLEHGEEIAIADAGPFDGAQVDVFGTPIRRVVFDGPLSVLRVRYAGPGAPSLKVSVR